jgi:hypothetical protein
MRLHASPVAWILALFVFKHRDRAAIAESAVNPGLRRIDEFAAPAAPRHMPAVAGAPDGADRPAAVAVAVAVWAAGWWHGHPSAIGRYEVANKVVGEFVARIGHCDVVPRTTDNECPQNQTRIPKTGRPGKRYPA